ncbi:hypothetical protein ACRRTK_010733 [Alexandromys fortis]
MGTKMQSLLYYGRFILCCPSSQAPPRAHREGAPFLEDGVPFSASTATTLSPNSARVLSACIDAPTLTQWNCFLCNCPLILILRKGLEQGQFFASQPPPLPLDTAEVATGSFLFQGESESAEGVHRSVLHTDVPWYDLRRISLHQTASVRQSVQQHSWKLTGLQKSLPSCDFTYRSLRNAELSSVELSARGEPAQPSLFFILTGSHVYFSVHDPCVIAIGPQCLLEECIRKPKTLRVLGLEKVPDEYPLNLSVAKGETTLVKAGEASVQ